MQSPSKKVASSFQVFPQKCPLPQKAGRPVPPPSCKNGQEGGESQTGKGEKGGGHGGGLGPLQKRWGGAAWHSLSLPSTGGLSSVKRGRAAARKPLPKSGLPGCMGPCAHDSPNPPPIPPQTHSCTREENHTGGRFPATPPCPLPTHPGYCSCLPFSKDSASGGGGGPGHSPSGSQRGPRLLRSAHSGECPPLWYSLGLLANLAAAAAAAGEVGADSHGASVPGEHAPPSPPGSSWGSLSPCKGAAVHPGVALWSVKAPPRATR